MSATSPIVDMKKLAQGAAAAGSVARFDGGEVLRQKGQFYRDLLLILEGEAEVRLGPSRLLTVGPGHPIGELGYLNGTAANATVTAKGRLLAWRLDDASMSALEAANPTDALALLRAVADTGQLREADNAAFAAAGPLSRTSPEFEILLCRNAEILTEAQRLRYAVYCEELGRSSPHADHQRKIIADELDDFGHVFVARSGGRTVGTIRANRPNEGEIGLYEELYDLRASPWYPDGVAISTKFVVLPEMRGTTLGLRLIGTLARFSRSYDIRECYCDCVPGLLHYYRALGFVPSGPPFLHRENGTSYPMRLDARKHRNRLEREPGWLQLTDFMVRSKLIKWFGQSPSAGGPAAEGARR